MTSDRQQDRVPRWVAFYALILYTVSVAGITITAIGILGGMS